MSRCGNCRGQGCSCYLETDCDAATGHCAEVLGIGTTYEPLQARLTDPEYRWVGAAYRSTAQAIVIGGNVISFEHSGLPITAGNMWNIAQPTRLTATIAGVYLISGYAAQANAGAGQYWTLWFSLNGFDVLAKKIVSTQNGGYICYNSIITLVRLSAGDYVELNAASDRATSTSSLSGFLDPSIYAQRVGA